MKSNQSRRARAAWALYVIAVWLCTEAIALVLGFFVVAMFASRPQQITAALLILCGAMLVPPMIFLIAKGPRWLRGHRARQRSLVNHCPTCGYNLAGLAAETSCPECGKVRTA